MRAIEIGYLEPQPCDGLHVRNTSEVGCLEVTSIERIGGPRWRVWLRLQDANVVSDAKICASA
ncbi:hypothetical protein [Neorhizobium sp. DT-125]|uniref:hypothetical protein n=1 Tax=Neorhizobium sp. DT-125 TaxID=3396163 RepID=UPI003F1C59F8